MVVICYGVVWLLLYIDRDKWASDVSYQFNKILILVENLGNQFSDKVFVISN